MTGSNHWEVEQKKGYIKTASDSRVRRRRALQILAGEYESPRSNPQTYPTHNRRKMDPENKRTFNPLAIEKSFTQEIGSKTATTRSNNESEEVIEISNEKENKNLPTITLICSPKVQERVEVEIFACDKINQSQGLIYILGYNIPDIEDYGRDLKKEYYLLQVKKAT